MWLFAINLVLIARKGISGLQLQRELGMQSYKGVFRMLRLIRTAMGTETHKDAFEAIVEIDETYVGGKPRKENTHKGKAIKNGKHTNGIESAWTHLAGLGISGVVIRQLF